MKKVLSLVLIGAMLFVPSFSGLKAEEGDVYVEENADKYAYGSVKEVTGNKIVLIDYDYENDVEIEIAFDITESTLLENISSLEELLEGDSIEVTFSEDSGKKVAKSIAKLEILEEDSNFVG